MFLSIMICSIFIFIFFKKSKQLFSVKTANLIEKTPFFSPEIRNSFFLKSLHQNLPRYNEFRAT